MRLMLVRNTDGEDIYINPKQIETIEESKYVEDTTIINFTSGNHIIIKESMYDFIQDLRRLPVDKVTLY